MLQRASLQHPCNTNQVPDRAADGSPKSRQKRPLPGDSDPSSGATEALCSRLRTVLRDELCRILFRPLSSQPIAHPRLPVHVREVHLRRQSAGWLVGVTACGSRTAGVHGRNQCGGERGEGETQSHESSEVCSSLQIQPLCRVLPIVAGTKDHWSNKSLRVWAKLSAVSL